METWFEGSVEVEEKGNAKKPFAEVFREIAQKAKSKAVEIRNINATHCGIIKCKNDAYFYIQGKNSGLASCNKHLAELVSDTMVFDARYDL
jgi:hypothetical protein